VQRVGRPRQGSESQRASPNGLIRRGRGPWIWLALSVGLVACVATWSPPARYYQRTAEVESAGDPVGAEECVACHDEVQGHAPAPEYHADCETCHGPGELHWESEMPEDIRYPSNDDCAACHETGRRTLMGWRSSQHARNNVLCSDCHNPHNREPLNVRRAKKVQGAVLRHASGNTQLCASCHPDVVATLSLPSHHPVSEGMMECTDCHQPHRDDRKRLGARTARCTSCHQDHAGPWIFEHTPVSEDCSYCHTAHGSSAEFLLEASQPGACITCHTVAESGAVHDPYAFVTRCTDCHGAVHGSFADPHLRR
jgi:DmsE family decaheme c-type cytochrome